MIGQQNNGLDNKWLDNKWLDNKTSDWTTKPQIGTTDGIMFSSLVSSILTTGLVPIKAQLIKWLDNKWLDNKTSDWTTKVIG